MTTTTTAARAAAVAQLVTLIQADNSLTGLDLRDITRFVDEDALCEGHESEFGPAGVSVLCNGLCVSYVGPGEPVVVALIKYTDSLKESAYDLMQSVELALGW